MVDHGKPPTSKRCCCSHATLESLVVLKLVLDPGHRVFVRSTAPLRNAWIGTRLQPSTFSTFSTDSHEAEDIQIA
jgi:hypothetical protein